MTVSPYTPLSEVRKMLDAKKVSSVELTRQCLERIEKYEPAIRAFVTITRAEALEQAAQADARRAKGESTPLLGIPFTIKDVFCTKGVKTTAGSNVLKDFVPAYDATVYARLRAAGAVLLGKTNCDAWGHGSSTENSDFGPTRNPWDTARVPGGSSGGSGAAVAAGFGFFSIAEDTGGSIRQPASFCNCTGIKVTYGRVSRFGAAAYASSLDTVGPIAHSAQDCEMILRVVAGPDMYDATTLQEPYQGSETVGTKKLSVGLPKEFFSKGLDPEVKDTIMAAVKKLEELGVAVREVSIPSTQYGVAAYYLIAPSETSSNLARYDDVRYQSSRDNFGDEAKRRIMLGTFVLNPNRVDRTYNKAQKVRRVLAAEFDEALTKVDAILGPVAPTPAFKIGENTDDPLAMYLEDLYTVLVNPTGCPSLALPSGFTPEGLPVGMQLIGKRGDEKVLFALAQLYQQHTDWHQREPKL